MASSEHPPKIVLTIAGFDPSSGAGATADLKTIAAHGPYGVAVLTALTVQTTQAVVGWQPLQADLVRESLEVLMADMPPSAVKIGMLGTGQIASIIADFLRSYRPKNVVLDPILKSSSGTDLIDAEGLAILREELVGLAEVITPNLAEASLLTGLEVRDMTSMKEACGSLKSLGARNVVITGGHLAEPTDLLAETAPDGTASFRTYPGERISTPNTHGTGCAFSTALACNLALGMNLGDSVQAAKSYVAEALRTSYRIGKGTSPVNHLYGFRRK